jgi:hypothetical protein
MPLTSLLTGSSVVQSVPPVAVIAGTPAYGVIGSVIQVTGQQSSNPSAQPSKGGVDGVTTGPTNLFASASGSFSVLDVNRILTIEGTGTDSGVYRIISIVSPTQVALVVAATGGQPVFVGAPNLLWSIEDSLTYAFSFVQTPIGSQVSIEGFKQLETDGSLVSFSPDIVGEYIIGLTVSNGTFTSPQVTARISIRAILVPIGRNIVPDGAWIWNYIRDVWADVENREWFETFWSALIQMVGADLLRLYQVDFNKSIRDIQDLYQRRWLSYEPLLTLTESDLTFYIGDQCAGNDATTVGIGNIGELIMISANEVIVVLGTVVPNASAPGVELEILYDSNPSGLSPLNIGNYTIGSVNLSGNGYKLSTPVPNYLDDVVDPAVGFYYSAGSTTWSLHPHTQLDYARLMSEFSPPIDELTPIMAGSGSSVTANRIRAGDVIQVKTGPNKGFYRILNRSGSFVVVDHAPVVGDTAILQCPVFRPVGFELLLPDVAVSNSFAVPYQAGVNDASVLAPGRVIIVNGQTYTILRAFAASLLTTPHTIILTSDGQILTGLTGLSWRAPDTLTSVSQDFEALGVSPGDLINIDVTNSNSSAIARIYGQVIGVDGNSLGFVLTNQPVAAGVVPPIPTETYTTLSSIFNIQSVIVNPDGSITLSGNALAIQNLLKSGLFSQEYFNVPLTEAEGFAILGSTFYLHFRSIVRNHTVPVDSTLKSVPVLQDWIVQPDWIEKDGAFFQIGPDGNQYDMARAPLSLVENTDFLIDNENAFHGQMTFATGTNIVEVQDGHFIDRGLRPGDQFIIQTPITLAGTYYISDVLSQEQIELSRPVPLYVLGSVVTANVEILRGRNGTFVRFIPGGFTALNPAPNRLWAEDSFFDNNPNVENNFGIMVGLTQAQLTSFSETINYRQAVAGLMYAYTQGSAINKIRLGAQIFLGLPFAEVAGVIQAIDTNYRLDVNGNPVQGRIVIQDTDANGNLLGTSRLYVYPIDVQSSLSGVETNPATGKTYAVGDSVLQFAILCKGVAVDDYITNPLVGSSGIAMLQQFHSMKLQANSTFFTLSEVGAVSEFLHNITPSYISYVFQDDLQLEETVTVNDSLSMTLTNRLNPLVDDASFSINTPVMFDSATFDGTRSIVFDNGAYVVRFSKAGLSTTYNGGTPSFVAICSTGGFLNPASGEGPVTRPGDYLLIRNGLNQGLFLITVVSSDTQVTVSGPPASGFQSASNQYFAVLRKVVAELQTGSTAATTASNTLVSVDVGLQANQVSPNDLLYISYSSGVWSLHTIEQVGPLPGFTDPWTHVTYPSVAAGHLVVTPAPTTTASGKTYHIFRKAFLEAPFTEYPGTLVSNGTTYTALTDIVTALLEIGDELLVQVTANTQLRVKAIDPRAFVFTPVLPAGSYTAYLCKKNHSSSPVGYDHKAQFDPYDTVALTLIPGSATATAVGGSPSVSITASTLASAPLPGDLFIFMSGSNASVDVGYGPGAFPIISGSTTTTVVLSQNAPNSQTGAFKILRRR